MTIINLNPFFSAARIGDIKILQYYLNHHIDIHLYNDLALRTAKESGQTEAVIFLLENGANINVLDDDSALRYSSLRGDYQSVKQLLVKGLCSEEAKLYATYNAIFYGYDKIIEILLNNGVNPTANNGAILRVLKLCKYDNIIALFKDYLK